MTVGLVVGGGGVGGIAWALGLFVAFEEAGVLASTWSSIVGTSAGATVGAQMSTGRLTDAFEAQFRPSTEISADVDLAAYRRRIADIIGTERDGRVARRRVGQMALDAATVAAGTRRAVVADRLSSAEWPDSNVLRITAVDVDTGELVVIGRNDGVSLVDAVTASCAVPGVWPVVTAAGRRLMDGGIRSSTNADLGRGDLVLVVVPSVLDERGRTRLQREVESRRVVVVDVDAHAAASIGPNPFDPSRRQAAATAGLEQGRRLASSLGPTLLAG